MEQGKKVKRDAMIARIILFLISAGLSVGAVFLFRMAGQGTGLLDRILAGVGGALTALFGALGWIVLAASFNRQRGNLFLYDRKTKTNLPPEALTWEIVREKLDFYFRVYLNGRRPGAIPAQLRVLLTPYILLTFLEGAPEGDWEKLLGGEKGLIDELSLSMNTLGEDEIGRQLQYYFGSYRGDIMPAKTALTAVGPRIETALLSYIRAHIAEYGN